jgi:hypothetical protein
MRYFDGISFRQRKQSNPRSGAALIPNLSGEESTVCLVDGSRDVSRLCHRALAWSLMSALSTWVGA